MHKSLLLHRSAIAAVLIGTPSAAALPAFRLPGPETTSPAAADDTAAARIRFNFKNQSWDQVLDWFSRASGLPIVRETPVPSGTIDYLSPRDYDLGEALQLLNILLQTQSVMLRVEADRLHLQKLEDMKRENIPTFVGDLPESITDDQIVTLLLPLVNAAAEPVSQQVAGLVAGYGSVVALRQQNALLVVETAGQVRRLKRLIDEIDREDVENIVEYIPLRHARATQMVQSLRSLLGERVVEFVINPQNNQRVKLEENRLPGLNLSADERTNSIIARGTRSRIDRVIETIAMLDIPRPGSGPRLIRTVGLGGETADSIRQKLDQIFAGAPRDERPVIVPLDDPSRIAISGDPTVVAEAMAAIEALVGDRAGSASDGGRAVTSLPLEQVSASAAIAALRPLLSPRQQATLSLAPGVDDRTLLVAGPADEVGSIEGLLALVDRPAPAAREVRFLTVPGDAAAVARRAEEIDRLRREPGRVNALVEATPEAGGEGAPARLRLVGTPESLDRFERSVREAIESAQPQAATRQIRLQRVKPSQIADRVRQMAAQLLDPRDGTPFVPPAVESVDPLDLLLVRARPAQFAQIEAIVAALDRPAEDAMQVRVMALAGAEPAALLQRAAAIWERTTPPEERARLGRPEVEIDATSGALLVSGHRDSVAAFERAVAEARRLEPPRREGRLLEVRQAKAAEVVPALRDLLASAVPQDPSRTPPAAEVSAVESLNAIFVVGEPPQLQAAERFLARLDVPSERELPPLRLLTVRSADATVIAAMLEERYRSRAAEEQRARPVRIAADLGGNTLAITAPPEIFEEIESLVREINAADRGGTEGREIRIFPIRIGRAAELAVTVDQMFPEPPVPVDARGRPRPDLRLPREVVVRAHEPTNSLIVDAPSVRMDDFARLVEQLDRQEAAPETQIRTYRLVRSTPDSVARTLRELASGGHLGGAIGARGAAAISIAVEPNTASVVVSGPSEIFERVEQVLESLDGQRPGPANDLRFFRLSKARAERVLPMVREILLARVADLVPASGARPADLVQVSADSATNALVVSGPEPIVALAAEVVRELDSGEAMGASTVRVRTLNFADAGQVAQSLAAALPGLTSPATGGPVEARVVASPGANALLLIGPPLELDEVERLIEPLDARPATDGVDAVSFELRYATATQIAPIVQRVLADQQQTDPRIILERMRRSRGQIDLTPPVRVEADPRTNSLLVSGPAQTVALAKSLIERLDAPDASAERSYRIFTPEKADPARLAQSAARVLDSTRPAGVRSTLELLAEPQAGAIVVMGTPTETERAITLLGELDGQAPSAPATGFRSVELRHGDAAALAGPLEGILRDRARWPESLQAAARAGVSVPEPRVTADGAANRVVVNAPEALIPIAVEVLAQLDQPRGETALETRVYTLARARANEVATALRQATDAAARTEPLARRPVVVPEPSSNSIVVTATEPQQARFEELVRAMDRSVGEVSTVRSVFLKHARAEQLVPLVRSLLDPEPEVTAQMLPGWAQVEYMRTRREQRNDSVRVAADSRLNAVILTGPLVQLDAAQRMVEQLDVAATAGSDAATSVELVALRHADATQAAQSLSAIFAESGGPPPLIRVEPSANALLVRANAEQLAQIRRIVDQLDRASAGGSRDVRRVTIDPSRGDAAEVARLLERMLDREGGGVEVLSIEDLRQRRGGAAPREGGTR